MDWSACHAFVHTMSVFRLSQESVARYLDALATDLAFSEFPVYGDLERYINDSGGEPLAWLNTMFEGTSPDALSKSRSVAVAHQLTDIIVDLREDLALGRLYLPVEDLLRFDVSLGDLQQAAVLGQTSDPIRALVLFEAARARTMYDASANWELLVAPFAREAARVMQLGWEPLLAQVERSGGDVFGTTLQTGSGRGRSPRTAPVRPRRRPGPGSRPDRDGAGAVGYIGNGAAVPRHVGIITDGNRRWARRNGVHIRAGHDRGADVLLEIGHQLLARGVEYLSVYSFSTENWNRDPEEINDLLDVATAFARSHVYEFNESNVRVRFLGRPQGLPAFVNRAMDGAEQWTSGNDGGTLAICLNYGGQTEIVDAVIATLSSGIAPSDLTTQDVADFLYAPDIPPLDLIIRTGGEQRLSNFMLWRAAYAELAFVPTLWPDFTFDELINVLDDYSLRARRFGH